MISKALSKTKLDEFKTQKGGSKLAGVWWEMGEVEQD